jgi:DNA replication and repair protein RecF
MNENLTLLIQNFSLFDKYKFEIDLTKKGLFLIDENGKGKTSLLKALYIILNQKPFYNCSLKDYIQKNKSFFSVELIEKDYFYFFGQIAKNGTFGKKIKHKKNSLKVFVYIPYFNNWLELERSKKIDILDFFFKDTLGSEYEDVLKKLNTVLKAKSSLIGKYHKKYKLFIQKNIQIDSNFVEKEDLYTLNELNKQILSISLKIWELREIVFTKVMQESDNFQNLINTKIQKIRLRYYRSDFGGMRNPFFQIHNSKFDSGQLIDLFQREYIANRNLFGAQRDDFSFEINNVSIQDYLSNGEKRIWILFLFSTFINIFKINNSEYQIWWFLDDVFNELDVKRERLVLENFCLNQDYFIITGTKTPQLSEEYRCNIELKTV